MSLPAEHPGTAAYVSAAEKQEVKNVLTVSEMRATDRAHDGLNTLDFKSTFRLEGPGSSECPGVQLAGCRRVRSGDASGVAP